MNQDEGEVQRSVVLSSFFKPVQGCIHPHLVSFILILNHKLRCSVDTWPQDII